MAASAPAQQQPPAKKAKVIFGLGLGLRLGLGPRWGLGQGLGWVTPDRSLYLPYFPPASPLYLP